MDKNLRIAIVHDNFAQMGGAERVADALCRTFPQADLYSTLAANAKLTPSLQARQIRTTWMQHLPAVGKYYRHYFMLYPLAIQSLDLREYDVILSSCFGYAKGLKRREDAVHICYCHTPMRWVWRYDDYTSREQMGAFKRIALPTLIHGLKRWDLSASQRPDFYIANSRIVADRIRTYYRREAVVIPPPIDVKRFTPADTHDDYYLVLSRLSAYKRIDLAIEACNRLSRRLVVIGDGPDRHRLEQLAGPTVEFLGRQPDSVVTKMLARCRALLFTGEEDFGMTPLETNAAGRPVIAFRGGGALETVIDGITGVFFDKPHRESLGAAIESFENLAWMPNAIRSHAEQFSEDSFSKRMLAVLQRATSGISRASERSTSLVIAA